MELGVCSYVFAIIVFDQLLRVAGTTPEKGRSRSGSGAGVDRSAPSGQRDNAEIPELDRTEKSQLQGPATGTGGVLCQMSPDSPRLIAEKAAMAERRAFLLPNVPSNLKEEEDRSTGKMTDEARKFLVQPDVVQDVENCVQVQQEGMMKK